MAIKLRWRLPPIDLPLAGAALGLVIIGLLTVYSATTVPGAHQGLWLKQLLWAFLAVGAAWLVVAVPFRVFDSLAWPAYVSLPTRTNGPTSWSSPAKCFRRCASCTGRPAMRSKSWCANSYNSCVAHGEPWPAWLRSA